MPFLDDESVRNLGLAAVGRNVRISDRAVFHGASRISIADHCRIDDFCVLSAGEGSIEIGRYVHIGPHGLLLGGGTIRLEDFCQLSSRVTFHSTSDDFHGEYLPGAVIPDEHRQVERAPIVLRRCSGLGASCVVLPGVELGEGTVVGAMSLVRTSCHPYSIYAGTPARRIKERGKGFLRRVEAILAAEGESRT